ncbi:MAG: protein adenylyltransferase SelO [Clostridium sp.]
MKQVIKNDKLNFNNTYTNLPSKLFSKVNPEEVKAPELVVFNESLAKQLHLDKDFLLSSEGIDLLSGNRNIEGVDSIAQAYAGHQFGHFTMLGDGRAILLGEYTTKSGEVFDIQLKGSGKTPYSRGGDGKAALGPMLREYIISEGMYSLGISTTRSLAVVKTGENILREKELQGAVLTRIAKGYIRVGTFEFIARWGTLEELKELADYTINRYYRECNNEDKRYVNFLNEVVKKQAELIAKWNLVGFVHGVMNTDNMSITGETIDYGPCAFIDEYDVNTVFSSIDINGRYAYGNQPNMGMWNLARFAETLLPLLSSNKDEAIEIAKTSIKAFKNIYEENWYLGMRRKLGLFNSEEEDIELIDTLLSLMQKYKMDYTNTFCNITLGKLDIYNNQEIKMWNVLWQERLKRQKEKNDEVRLLMEKNNPRVIPRNHRVEEALADATNGDYTTFEALLKAINTPYDYKISSEYYTEEPKNNTCNYKTYCGT